MKLKTMVGMEYFIREWDGSIEKVFVTGKHLNRETVTFQYDDGLTHEVGENYFTNGLKASEVQ